MSEIVNAQPLPVKWVEKLFSELSTTYGKLFVDMWSVVDIDALKEKWGRELAGFTGDELARGLLACSSREFPPTLPKFKMLCRPALDSEYAFNEAVKGMVSRESGKIGNWSHPAVFWAAVRMGNDLRSYPFNQIKNRWESLLADSWAKGQWDAIPEPAEALPAPEKSTMSKDEAKARLNEIMNMVKGRQEASQ